ncbi:MAG: DUF1254 domain-containing protein [Hyphomonadaceae bacterium]
MRSWVVWTISTLVVAALAHVGFMFMYPNVVMSAAMARMSAQGENEWRHVARVTEASRVVVRPSPDLAYSACVYNLASGPVAISVSPWGDYMSLSLFAANTDNYYTLNDRSMPAEGVTVILRRPDQELTEAERGSAFAVVDSPSQRGVALIRRLAPTMERFEQADAARRLEQCAQLR